jgi:prenyltransferase beta subunit
VVLDAALGAGCARDDVMAKKAVEWLKSCQNQDGGYGMPKASPSLAASTAWCVRALTAYGLPSTDPSVKNAVEWLMKTEKPAGGFSMVPPAPADPEATAYVIMALAGQPGMKTLLAKAADYLSTAQHPDGSYTSNLPVQFNREAKKNTQTTLFVAWALSEMK